jgi:hypothetical protein
MIPARPTPGSEVCWFKVTTLTQAHGVSCPELEVSPGFSTSVAYTQNLAKSWRLLHEGLFQAAPQEARNRYGSFSFLFAYYSCFSM